MKGVTVVDHPLVQHKLTLMRDKDRSTKGFRQLLNEIGMLLCYEVTRDLPLETVEIETPLTRMTAPADRRQEARVRADPARRRRLSRRHAEPGALGPRRPYRPLPRSRHARRRSSTTSRRRPTSPTARCWCSIPMLATGNSAVAAVDRLKERGAKDMRFVCLIAAPEGIERLPRRPSRRADLDRGDRQPPQRSRLHRAGPRRRRRPDVRDPLACAIL